MKDIERVGVLANPVSTEHARLRNALGELVQANISVDYAETTPNTATNFERLAKLNARNQLVVIASGDGTVRNLVSTALSHHLDLQPLLVFGLGNANDLAHSLHNNTRSMVHMIQTGEVEHIRPLEALIESPSTTTPARELVLSYFGLGISAKVGKEINEQRGFMHRKYAALRHPVDTVAAQQGIFFGPRFTAKIGSETQPERYVSIEYLHGPHYLRTNHEGADIANPEYVKEVILQDRDLGLRSLQTIRRITQGRFGAVVPMETVHIHDITGLKHAVWSHFDGETRPLEDGSALHIQAVSQTLPLLVLPNGKASA